MLYIYFIYYIFITYIITLSKSKYTPKSSKYNPMSVNTYIGYEFGKLKFEICVFNIF